MKYSIIHFIDLINYSIDRFIDHFINHSNDLIGYYNDLMDSQIMIQG